MDVDAGDRIVEYCVIGAANKAPGLAAATARNAHKSTSLNIVVSVARMDD